MIKIPLDSKILNVTHVDLDGCGCSIVLGNVFKNITYIFASFYNLDKRMEEINFDEYDYVIMTDIHPTEKRYLDISEKIILIDHHPSEFNNPKKNRFVVSDKGVCATSLVKFYVEKLYNIKLPHLDKLVTYINDYDMWILEHPESKMMNDLMFYHYRPTEFREAFIDGRTQFTPEETKFLEELHLDFLKTYEDMDVYNLDTINACVIYEDKFINEVADNLIKEVGYDLVVIKSPTKGRCSLRTSNDSIDIGQILEDFGWGGGHPKSAGLFVKTMDEFTRKMDTLEEYLHSNYETIRKD